MPYKKLWALAETDAGGRRTTLPGRFASKAEAEAKRKEVVASDAYPGCTVQVIDLLVLEVGTVRPTERRGSPVDGEQHRTKYSLLQEIVEHFCRTSMLLHFGNTLAELRDREELLQRALARPSRQGLQIALARDPVKGVEFSEYAHSYAELTRAEAELRRDWQELRGVPNSNRKQLLAFCKDGDPVSGRVVADQAWLLARIVSGEVAFPEPKTLRSRVQHVRSLQMKARHKRNDGEALLDAFANLLSRTQGRLASLNGVRAEIERARRMVEGYVSGHPTPDDLRTTATTLRRVLTQLSHMRLASSALVSAGEWTHDKEISAVARRAGRELMSSTRKAEMAAHLEEEARAAFAMCSLAIERKENTARSASNGTLLRATQAEQLQRSGLVCEVCGRTDGTTVISGTGFRPVGRAEQVAFHGGREPNFWTDPDAKKALLRLMGKPRIRLCKSCMSYLPDTVGDVDLSLDGQLHVVKPLLVPQVRAMPLGLHKAEQSSDELQARATLAELFAHLRSAGTRGRYDRMLADALLRKALLWHEARDYSVPDWWVVEETEPQARYWGLRRVTFGHISASQVTCLVWWEDRRGQMRRTVLLAPTTTPQGSDHPVVSLMWSHVLAILYDVTHRHGQLMLDATPDVEVSGRVISQNAPAHIAAAAPNHGRGVHYRVVGRHSGPGWSASGPRSSASQEPYRVRGHLRHIQGSASEEQRELAMLDLGIQLPPHGLTYVTPHLAHMGLIDYAMEATNKGQRVHLVPKTGALTLQWSSLFQSDRSLPSGRRL